MSFARPREKQKRVPFSRWSTLPMIVSCWYTVNDGITFLRSECKNRCHCHDMCAYMCARISRKCVNGLQPKHPFVIIRETFQHSALKALLIYEDELKEAIAKLPPAPLQLPSMPTPKVGFLGIAVRFKAMFQLLYYTVN